MIYKRVLLKLSGESIGGADGSGIDESVLSDYAAQIADAVRKGTEVAIVIGGGNIFRGLSGVNHGFDRVRGDQMGMLATVINSIGVLLALKKEGLSADLFTATPMDSFGTYFNRDKVVDCLKAGGVAILAGGTGNPFFTTDSAAALRACEIGADLLLKGTRVDGVYNADPEKNRDAVKYEMLSFDRAIAENLKIMDATAFALCKENNLPIVVFNMNIRGNLLKLTSGEKIGTLISNAK